MKYDFIQTTVLGIEAVGKGFSYEIKQSKFIGKISEVELGLIKFEMPMRCSGKLLCSSSMYDSRFEG